MIPGRTPDCLPGRQYAPVLRRNKMAQSRVLVRKERRAAGSEGPNGAADEASVRLANSRDRMRELLLDPTFAAEARQAMAAEEPVDEIVEWARAGAFAEQAFIEGYGAEFVQAQKSSLGG
jgi:hypothetical protein